MSEQKVIAYRWKGSTVWQNGSGPKGAEADHVRDYHVQIEYAYTKAEPDPILEQLAEALRAIADDHDFCVSAGDTWGDRREAYVETARAALSAYEARRKP